MTNSNFDELKNNFRMDLAQEGYELRKMLSQNDILDKNVLQNCLDTVGDHIKVLCLKYSNAARKYTSLASYRMNAPESEDWIATTLGSLLSGIGGLLLAGMTVTTVTTGMWWWKTTSEVSLAAYIAGALGIGAGVATGGIALALGAGGGYAVSKLTKNMFKEKLISTVMRNYENKVTPQLLEWFDNEIGKCE
ncbi:hypothetical protein J6253_05880 [bacterium]|nr:hypothetical protein [bacterium]MBP5592353.1 hypothetical protein [bacterium]